MANEKKTRAMISLDLRLYFVGSGSFTPCGVQDETSKKRATRFLLSLFILKGSKGAHIF